MADDQNPSIGWGGQVWLHDGVALYKLRQVTSFTIPPLPEAEQVDVTHLESEDKMQEFIDGLLSGTGAEVQVVMNFRPGSDTDLKLEAAYAARDVRQAVFVVPIGGVPTRMYTVNVKVTAYDPGTVEPGAKMKATATFQIKSVRAAAPYAAPGA